jgi:F0F1-type ATP synthase membrane subunit b/b'
VPETQISDVIVHLFEEEKKAASLLAEAQAEADKRLAHARAEAADRYKSGFESLIADLENSYAKESAELTQKYESDMNSYRAGLAARKFDTDAFGALLDKLLKRA